MPLYEKNIMFFLFTGRAADIHVYFYGRIEKLLYNAHTKLVYQIFPHRRSKFVNDPYR